MWQGIFSLLLKIATIVYRLLSLKFFNKNFCPNVNFWFSPNCSMMQKKTCLKNKFLLCIGLKLMKKGNYLSNK